MTEPHLGGGIPGGDSNLWMPDVFGYLMVKHNPKRVLDTGCGYGHALKWFADIGCCDVKGVDGDPEIEAKWVGPAGTFMLHDFTKGVPAIGTPFDLGLALEFVEHVEEKFIPNFMGAFNLCRRVVITHGEPGQHGHHHVNCKPSSYWVKQFSKYGFGWDEDETELLRRTDRWKASWGRRSLLSFSRL